MGNALEPIVDEELGGHEDKAKGIHSCSDKAAGHDGVGVLRACMHSLPLARLLSTHEYQLRWGVYSRL